MQIARWNPLREFESFFRHNRPLAQVAQSTWPSFDADWVPSVDVVENDSAFIIKAELPAVNKDDIKIQTSQGMLTISGERKQEQVDEKEHRIECFYGTFSRSFTLPDNIKEEDISADYKNGMLYLTLPKSEVTKVIGREIMIH